MIRVTVEMLPGGFGPVQHLGTAIISNDGTGTPQRGNYNVRLSPRGNPKRVWRRGRVLRFPRKRRSAWHLLEEALAAALGKTS